MRTPEPFNLINSLEPFDEYVYASGDFMLGDFVYAIDKDGAKKVVKINSLTKRKIGFINEKTGKQNYIRNEEKRIRPIPIEDWPRLKNTHRIDLSLGVHINVYDDVAVVTTCGPAKVYPLYLSRKTYVHDIQHILALSREHIRYQIKKYEG